ncbi:MAG: thiamine phosphate synthase [Sphingomonadales bacterium]
MHRRHPPLPRIWLMTDERIDDLPAVVMRLPKGAGIVFRHHATAPQARRALFERIKIIARRRRLLLLLADTPARARAWGADGAHHRSTLRSRGLRTVAVHDGRELQIARVATADLVFVSPVFATRSHVGARTLGPVRLGLMVGTMRKEVVALGGMNARQFNRLNNLQIHGWAAIDALGQKRNAVPT